MTAAMNADIAALIDDAWMTTADVAAYTQFSETHIRRAAALGVEHGGIRSTSAGRGRGRRYKKSWVDEWMHQPRRSRNRS